MNEFNGYRRYDEKNKNIPIVPENKSLFYSILKVLCQKEPVLMPLKLNISIHNLLSEKKNSFDIDPFITHHIRI